MGVQWRHLHARTNFPFSPSLIHCPEPHIPVVRKGNPSHRLGHYLTDGRGCIEKIAKNVSLLAILQMEALAEFPLANAANAPKTEVSFVKEAFPSHRLCCRLPFAVSFERPHHFLVECHFPISYPP
jgi:hypothetical protein